ncbi:MAG TPA: hypothetical protein VFL86_06230, partial [Burkholderiaceae bacterium]|nr:hypothetical protein [Burkholderiaceae bacterium]
LQTLPQPMPSMPSHAPAMHAPLQVQHLARQYAAQAQAFDAVMLQQQVAQTNLQRQTLQTW